MKYLRTELYFVPPLLRNSDAQGYRKTTRGGAGGSDMETEGQTERQRERERGRGTCGQRGYHVMYSYGVPAVSADRPRHAARRRAWWSTSAPIQLRPARRPRRPSDHPSVPASRRPAAERITATICRGPLWCASGRSGGLSRLGAQCVSE